MNYKTENTIWIIIILFLSCKLYNKFENNNKKWLENNKEGICCIEGICNTDIYISCDNKIKLLNKEIDGYMSSECLNLKIGFINNNQICYKLDNNYKCKWKSLKDYVNDKKKECYPNGYSWEESKEQIYNNITNEIDYKTIEESIYNNYYNDNLIKLYKYFENNSTKNVFFEKIEIF